MKWPVEYIPDEDLQFYRVHRGFIREGNLIPGVFREQGRGKSRSMSTNWAKYSDANTARLKASKPEDNGIISFITKKLRKISLSVTHAPSKNDRSHTDVKGIGVEARVKLMSLFTWEIKTPGM